jgi:hypothetical protein
MATVVAIYDAKGGDPANVKPKADADGKHFAGLTHSGSYLLHHTAQHVSGTWAFSKVRWGVPIKEDPAHKDVLYEEPKGHWHSVRKKLLAGVKGADKVDVIEELKDVWVKIQEAAGSPTKDRTLPSTWQFNDFGHATWYMVKENPKKPFKPLSGKIHPEFLHTTQVNEYQDAPGLPVLLDYSHGCIHVTPDDMDDMNVQGYLKSGVRFVVHRYDAKPAVSVDPAAAGKKFKRYEVHFFPGIEKVVVYGY